MSLRPDLQTSSRMLEEIIFSSSEEECAFFLFLFKYFISFVKSGWSRSCCFIKCFLLCCYSLVHYLLVLLEKFTFLS